MILRRFNEIFKYKSKLTIRNFDAANISGSYSVLSKTFPIVNSNFKKVHTSTVKCGHFRYKMEFIRNTLINSENENSILNSLMPENDIDVKQAEFLIEQDWTKMNDIEVLTNFKILSQYAQHNNEILNAPKYERIVEALSSRCPNYSNEELLYILNYLILWDDKNNKQITTTFWRTLDKEFCRRFKEWSTSDMLYINDNIFKLNRLNYTKFSKICVKKLARKVNLLDKSQLLQLLFLTNILPRLEINIYNFEHRLETLIDDLSIDEIALFAMPFYKYNNFIKTPELNKKILQKTYERISDIDDTFLSAILKTLRIVNTGLISLAQSLLEAMETQISSRPLSVVIKIFEFQGKSLMHNERLTLEILKRLEAEIETVRFNDILKIVIGLTLLNYDPKTTSIYSIIIDELMKRNIPRLQLLQILCHLAVVNYYNEEALKYVSNVPASEGKDDAFYAKSNQLFLNYSLKIDWPEYGDTKCEEEKFIKSRMRLLKFKNHVNKIRDDVVNTCKKITDSESAVYSSKILPHTQIEYIIMCYDQNTKQFRSPEETLSKFHANQIKYAPVDGNTWYALLPNTNAHKIKGTDAFTGDLVMQLRQLERIGYKPVAIFADDWEKLDSNEKEAFISKMLCI